VPNDDYISFSDDAFTVTAQTIAAVVGVIEFVS
jgi:hypothetical protein